MNEYLLFSLSSFSPTHSLHDHVYTHTCSLLQLSQSLLAAFDEHPPVVISLNLPSPLTAPPHTPPPSSLNPVVVLVYRQLHDLAYFVEV